MGHSVASKVMNQRLHLHMFAASGVHPIIIPPLLSTEAPDATRPSLSVRRFPSPGRRVSGLGRPELTRLMPFASAAKMKLSVQWIDGLTSRSFDFNLLKSDLHNSLATRCSSWNDGWNQIQIVETNRSVIEWISRDCPFSQNLPTKKTVSDFTWVFTFVRQGSRKYQTPQFKDL